MSKSFLSIDLFLKNIKIIKLNRNRNRELIELVVALENKCDV